MMKKIINVIFSLVFLSSNAIANDLSLTKFHEWLFENGHTEYVTKEESKVCKAEPKYSNLWYYNKCDQAKYKNNLKIKFYDGWIPEQNVKPNYGTLVYELFRFIERPFKVQRVQKYEVEPSSNPYEFRSSLKEDKYVDKQLKKTALLSYLHFEGDQITIDKISPNDRFGKFINNETKLRSMSVGRSMASYTLAHAICDGYIDSFDTRLDDWPLLENTLYYNQKLSDILNMNSGDHKYIEGFEFINSKGLKERFKGSLDDHMVSLEQYLIFI
jgi:hypothetical protein